MSNNNNTHINKKAKIGNPIKDKDTYINIGEKEADKDSKCLGCPKEKATEGVKIVWGKRVIKKPK